MRKTVLVIAVALFGTLGFAPSAGAVSKKTVNTVAKFEGFYSCPYRDPAGYLTIGYGHRTNRSVKCWSKAKAKRVLRNDLGKFEREVLRRVPRRIMHTLMLGSLTSFAFNLGPGMLDRTPSPNATNISAHVRKGNHRTVVRQMKLFRTAGGRVLPGLVKRRTTEGRMYLKGARALNRRMNKGPGQNSQGGGIRAPR